MVNKSLSILFLALIMTGCESLSKSPDSTCDCSASCPASETSGAIIPKGEDITSQSCQKLKNKLIIGQAEYTHIAPSGWKMKSRIDSGATTTSIDARDIKGFERDGKKWVRFKLFNRDTKETFEIEKPVSRMVEIKRHGTGKQTRYVVELDLTIGSISERVEVSLTDRSDFTFPVLIGRNFLVDRAVIDVSKKYVAKLPATKENEQ